MPQLPVLRPQDSYMSPAAEVPELPWHSAHGPGLQEAAVSGQWGRQRQQRRRGSLRQGEAWAGQQRHTGSLPSKWLYTSKQPTGRTTSESLAG